MKVVLAEKPSVARDIAAALGVSNRKDGYFEGENFIVTYAFGHLVTIAEPETMNPAWGSPWRLQQLPMIPEDWKYRVPDNANQQFGIIKKLFSDPKTTSIVCATDAGREGENIFRLIYDKTGCTLPVERLWISSLTTEAIKDGFKKLKPARDFDNLASAASARARADWIVGLNFTRAYTAVNGQLCTIGRVQTPTLALLVERQAAIDNFKAVQFFEIIVTFEPGFTARYITPGKEPSTRLDDKAMAQAIMTAVNGADTGVVESVVTAEKKTRAPGLYDLLTLQKEANKRFGYTAQETLDIAQSLYEEFKLISYPRTESRHLSTDMVDELPGILTGVLKSNLASKDVREVFKKEGLAAGSITADLLRPMLGKNYVDDAKLTDHHAIIPTNKPCPENLPERQKNVYQLIARRFLSIFMPPEIRDETTVIIKLAGRSFRAKGVVLKDPGWTIVDPKAAEKADKESKGSKGDKESKEDMQQLPALEQDQEVQKRKAELKQGKTSPPKPYDDSSLLSAMKNAGQELDDEDLATYMKKSGLGTPATRAAIIERLIKTNYVERNKKAIAPTAKGIALINSVHDDLKNVALTATWEQRLADMQDGKLALETFESDIAGFVRRVLPDVRKQAAAMAAKSENSFGKCPRCEEGVIRKTPNGAGCSQWKEGCAVSIWREQYGKKLTDEEIKELVAEKRTKVIEGFQKKDGSGSYNARLCFNEEFKVRLNFDP